MTGFESVVLDVDGTLVRGGEPIPGAAAALDRIREAGADVLLFSNNPTREPAAYGEWLGDLGFDVRPGEVLTSGVVTAEYLADEHPDDPVYVVGEQGLCDLLAARDRELTDDPERAAVVVGSIDRGFTYDRLRDGLWALDGAAFVATDPDRTIPAEGRPLPGSGAIVAALAGAADRDPEVVLGKPSERAATAALDRIRGEAGSCLVVGDRLDTDLAMGRRAGMATALVLSGVATREDAAAADPAPDYVLESIADLPDAIADR